MDDLGIIDRFTQTFLSFIDNGFGLLGPDVGFLLRILIGIDIVLAGLAWAFQESGDVVAQLLRKVLYVGAFALILNNFSFLADVVFDSFVALGLRATGSPIAAVDLLRPGFVASAGVQAAHPILAEVQTLIGFPGVLVNAVEIFILLLAWIVILIAFFVLAVQMFVTLVEFKLIALAGFVLVPFALWGKTIFLAERVLGNVVSAGIKVMVLAVIVGIGSTIFDDAARALQGQEVTIERTIPLVLAALSLLGIGIYGPRIASGLVSGGPQLGAESVTGTLGSVAGVVVATGGTAVAGGQAAARGASGAMRAASHVTELTSSAATAPGGGAVVGAGLSVAGAANTAGAAGSSSGGNIYAASPGSSLDAEGGRGEIEKTGKRNES